MGGAGERGRGLATTQGAAAASLSGKKRKRESEDGGSGSGSGSGAGGHGLQLLELRHSATPVPRADAAVLTLPPLQQLVDACRAMLDGSTTPPAAAAVHSIRRIMGRIGPHDVGLMDEIHYFHEMNMAGHQNPPIITCKNILDCKNFTIAVFFLPLGAAMPLHDHPGMTVFSKLLIGTAHVEAYDWVRPRVSGRAGSAMLAEKVLDRDVSAASGTWSLFPNSGGNMHRFVAGEETHCAFLDVLTPPYAPDEQRSCSYYKDYPCKLCPCARKSGLAEALRNRRRLAWLEEVPEPSDLRVVDLPYQGPKIS